MIRDRPVNGPVEPPGSAWRPGGLPGRPPHRSPRGHARGPRRRSADGQSARRASEGRPPLPRSSGNSPGSASAPTTRMSEPPPSRGRPRRSRAAPRRAPCSTGRRPTRAAGFGSGWAWERPTRAIDAGIGTMGPPILLCRLAMPSRMINSRELARKNETLRAFTPACRWSKCRSDLGSAFRPDHEECPILLPVH